MNLSKPTIEALKELGRVVLLAVIPALTIGLEQGQIDPRVLGTIAAVAGLRAVDKLLHESGKESGNDTLSGGLTRF